MFRGVEAQRQCSKTSFGNQLVVHWEKVSLLPVQEGMLEPGGASQPPWHFSSQWHGHWQCHFPPDQIGSGFQLSGLFCAPSVWGSVFFLPG